MKLIIAKIIFILISVLFDFTISYIYINFLYQIKFISIPVLSAFLKFLFFYNIYIFKMYQKFSNQIFKRILTLSRVDHALSNSTQICSLRYTTMFCICDLNLPSLKVKRISIFDSYQNIVKELWLTLCVWLARLKMKCI